MGCHPSARHSLLPASLSQHLPWGSTFRSRCPGVASQEQVPAAGTQHIHVCPDGDQSRLRRLHRLPAAMFQAAAVCARAPSQTTVVQFFLRAILFYIHITLPLNAWLIACNPCSPSSTVIITLFRICIRIQDQTPFSFYSRLPLIITHKSFPTLVESGRFQETLKMLIYVYVSFKW